MVYPHFEICFNIDLQLANKRTLTCKSDKNHKIRIFLCMC